MNSAIQPYRGDYLRPAFRNATVADVMTPGIITCAPETPLETVDLVVVDCERPVGVISTLDVAGAVAWGRR